MPKPVAHSFILETLLDSKLSSQIRVKPMFGSHAIYVGDTIVFILRQRDDEKTRADNGLWVTSIDGMQSLRADFPLLRPIEMFQRDTATGVPSWNNLPESDPGFEENALALCELVIKGDFRIGKIPGQKKSRTMPSTKRNSKKKISKKGSVKKV